MILGNRSGAFRAPTLPFPSYVSKPQRDMRKVEDQRARKEQQFHKEDDQYEKRNLYLSVKSRVGTVSRKESVNGAS